MKSRHKDEPTHLSPPGWIRRYRLGISDVVLYGERPHADVDDLLRKIVRLTPVDPRASGSCRPSTNRVSNAGESRQELRWLIADTDAQLSHAKTVGEESRTGPLVGRETESGFLWSCGDSSLEVFPRERQVVVQIRPDFWAFSFYLQRQFFLMAFYILFRQVRQYGIHANGVVHDGKACLIAGDSGSGKSTLALCLVLHRWKFWGDDTILLRRHDDQDIVGTSLRHGLSCSATTSRMSGDIENLYSLAPSLQDDKRLVDVESLPCVSTVQEARPDIVIFPVIGDGKNSEVAPVDQTVSMARLVGLSTGILADRVETRRQMKVLEQLTRQTRAFSVAQGSDVFNFPERVSTMLADAAGCG